jgi:hypothetical protein
VTGNLSDPSQVQRWLPPTAIKIRNILEREEGKGQGGRKKEKERKV